MSRSKLQIFRTSVIVFLLCLWTVMGSRHGEPCDNSADPCVPSTLMCPSGVCVCPNEATTIFDTATQACYTIADQPCNPIALKCILSASCDNTNTGYKCVCNGELESNSTGHCHLNYGKSCSDKNDRCDPNQFLSCNLYGKCDCPKGSFYELNNPAGSPSEKCVLLPGSNCSNTVPMPKCVYPTQCQVDPADRSQKCRCPGKSKPVPEDPRNCYLSHDQSCNMLGREPVCNPFAFLQCQLSTDGDKCLCQDEPGRSIFDLRTRTCLRLAGEDCDPDSGMKCIFTASCIKSQGTSKCICNGEMAANSTGHCHLGFDKRCSSSNDRCDPNQSLYCDLHGKCACPKGALYKAGDPSDPLNSGNCVLLPGSICSTNPADPGSLIQCIDGTTCLSNATGLPEKCTCPGNSKPDSKDPTKCFLSHGETCTRPGLNPICNTYSFLECSGKCRCQGEPSTSIFDPKTGTCFRLAEEECDPKSGMKCIPTSSCFNSQGKSKCICNGEMTNNSTGHCHLQLGQSCNARNDLCDPNQFLSCDLHGQCSCSKDAFYDSTEGSCVLFPGSLCSVTSSLKCADRSTCSVDPIDRKTKCRCPGTSHPVPQDPKKCYLSHSDSCHNLVNECDPYSSLICQDGRCICQGENLTSTFDPRTKSCHLFAQESCDPNNGMKCVRKSKCLKSKGLSTCTCDEPLTPNAARFCSFKFNQSCTDVNDLCDPTGFLSCDLKGRCSCSKDAIFYTDTNRCKLLANATCAPYGGIGQNQPCVPHADCSNSGKCECLGDYTGNIDRECFLQHGSFCDPMRDACDPQKSLTCSPMSMTCTCNDELNTFYNPSLKTCFGLIGASCKNNIGSVTPKCIPNAVCDQGDQTCTCNGTLVPNRDRFCYLPYDATCSTSNDLCDPGTFLECNKYTNKCGCAREYETYYDPGSKSCRLNHDRPCSAMEDSQLCDPNANCLPYGGGNATFRCQCLENMLPNAEKLCYLLRDQNCIVNDPTARLCDPYGHLVCRKDKGTCDCGSDEMYFDSETKTCVTFPNAPCSTIAGSQKCTPNSVCLPSEGVCRCLDGFEETVDGKCYRKYGSSCDEGTNLCNFQVNLECSAGLCLCKDGYLEQQKIIGDKESQTICLPGFNSTCLAASSSGNGCNEEAFLICHQLSKRCVCPSSSDQIYLRSARQCRSLSGSPCNQVDLICIPNADCTPNGAPTDSEVVGTCTCDGNSTLATDNSGLCISNSGGRNIATNTILAGLLIFIYFCLRN